MASGKLEDFQAQDLVTQATQAIRDGILAGKFLPGEQLKEQRVAEMLGFSRNTIRQALARIAGEGFATAVPRVGVFVRRMTVEEQREVFEYRLGIEMAACALAAHKATDEELEELEALGDEVDRAYAYWLEHKSWDWNRLYELEVEFHARLIELAHNRELASTITRPKIIFWTYNLFKSGRSEFLALVQERSNLPVLHAEIAREIASRDAARATIAIHGALAHTLELFDLLQDRDGMNEQSPGNAASAVYK